MNFLSFRDQIYDWTLESDENLFNNVNQLTQYIFQTEKVINESVVLTKANLNQNSTILNNNFNHYLRLSETKFTQNKIGEPKRTVQQTPSEQVTVQPKSKIDIYKQALGLSVKNLQIKDNDNEQDNVSVSQMSLSQAIFKNARLPPYFGSKQFRAQKFLNLFYDEDLNQSVYSKRQIDNISISSSQPLSTPSQNITSTNFGNLPPPPSLDSLNLGFGISTNASSTSGLLPPPPLPTGLLPPPPPLLNTLPSLPNSLPMPPPLIKGNVSSPAVLIEQKDPNKELLESILMSQKNMGGYEQQRQSIASQPEERNSYVEPQPEVPIPKNQNKPLTFQEELALKLKHGKDYKPPAPQVIQNITQPQRNQPQSRSNQISYDRSNSFRQSTAIEQIIGSTAKPISKQQQPKQNPKFMENNDEEQEEQNALFGGGKRKTVNPSSTTQNNKFGMGKSEADIMMSRSTFNEDMLFKKKAFSKESVLPSSSTNTKTQQNLTVKQDKMPNRASKFFNQDSDQQQQDFTFKKKTNTKTNNSNTVNKVQQQKKSVKQESQSPKRQVQEKKGSNPLITSNQSPLGQPISTSKKQIKQEQPKKKTVNKLFGNDDSDEESDLFAKKKPLTKTKEPESKAKQPTALKSQIKSISQASQSPKPAIKKVNSLFNNDEDQQDDLVFKSKPKAKETKKQQPVKVQQKVQAPKIETIQPVKQQPQNEKKKINTIHQQQNEQGSQFFPSRKVSQVQAPKKQFQKTINNEEANNQQESQEKKRMKRIAAMGGQAMMGMTQLIPQGMKITKPSQTKTQQKIARQNLQNQSNIPVVQSIKNDNNEQPQQKSNVNSTPQVKRPPLDPLQKLIVEVTKTQESLESKKPQTKSIVQVPSTSSQKSFTNVNTIPKQQQKQIQGENQNQATGLALRRKKNKPKNKIFDDEDFDQTEEKKQVKTVVVTSLDEKKPTHIKEQPFQKSKKSSNPLSQENIKMTQEKQSHIAKMSRMGMAGMAMPGMMAGMGMGPLIPKGMIITKPSQAKRIQQETLERIKKQQEQRKIQQKEESEQRQVLLRQQQQENHRKRLQQQQESYERQRQSEEQERIRLLEQQNKIKRKQEQQNSKRQKILQQQQKQRQRQIKIYQQQQQRERQLQRQRQIRKFEQEQQKRRRQEQIKLIQERQRQQAQVKKQKSNLPSLPVFDIGNKKPISGGTNLPLGKNVNSNPLDIPKMPQKINPLGGSLGNPLGGGLSKKPTNQKSPLLMPPMPMISNNAKISPKKNNLFGDQDQQDSKFSKKTSQLLSKPTVESSKKSSLFDDNQDDEFMSFNKPKAKKNTFQSKQTKPQQGKKSLFDDDDDDQGLGFGKKSKKSNEVKPIMEQRRQQKSNIPQSKKQVPAKKGILGNDSEQEDNSFLTKKTQKQIVKQVPKQNAPVNTINQVQPKVPSPPKQKEVSKKTNKRNLFDESDEQESPISLKKPQNKSSTNNLTVNPVERQTSTKISNLSSKQTKSKRGLFNQSDSEDDPFKKKKPAVQAKNQPVKQVSQPIVSNKTPEVPSSSKNLLLGSKPKVTSSPLSNPLLGGNSPLSMPSQKPTSNPQINVKQTTAPKKRSNIFDQSQQQSQSPVLSSKKGLNNSKATSNFSSKPIAVQQEQTFTFNKPTQPIKKQQQQETLPVPTNKPAQSTNNNRKLFDSSENDSDDEEMAKKKRQATKKLKGMF